MEKTITAAPAVTPDAIFQLAAGFMASKMFFTAAEIGLFAQLAEDPLPPGHDEVREWLEQCGWRFIEHRPLAGPVSVVIAEK